MAQRKYIFIKVFPSGHGERRDCQVGEEDLCRSISRKQAVVYATAPTDVPRSCVDNYLSKLTLHNFFKGPETATCESHSLQGGAHAHVEEVCRSFIHTVQCMPQIIMPSLAIEK